MYDTFILVTKVKFCFYYAIHKVIFLLFLT